MEPSHADALRRAAAQAIEFREHLNDRAQRPELDYAAMLERWAAPLPETGTEAAEVVDRLAALAAPGLNAMAGPRFFGWVIGGSHPVGVAADWLTSAWGQNCASHDPIPAAAACEAVAAQWLLELLDLPRDASVGFVSGATMANFVGLAAARGEVLRRVGWDVEADGLAGAPPIRVLAGDEAHVSVASALQYLGLGRERAVRVATDRAGAIDPRAFEAALGAPGGGPLIAILQGGQLNTGAFDPYEALIPLAHAHGGWVHVDAAFGLWARAAGGRKALTAGLERADSWSTDGHKWLQTPYDCGYAIVRDAAAHRRAMGVSASYLPSAAAGERDPSQLVPELSRRARGFATWAMLAHLGRRGVEAMVERHCALARLIAETLAREPEVELLNDVVLNQAILRFGASRPAAEGDRLTQATIERVQHEGTCFVSGALWRGRRVMRLSVSNAATTEDDALRSARAIAAAWAYFR